MPITDNYYYEPLYPARPQRKNFGAAPIIRIFYQRVMSPQQRDNSRYWQRAVSQNLGFRKSQGYLFGQ